jgi:predicted Zn-dependent protease
MTGAVMVASGDARAAQISAIVGNLINMQFSREDEVEADRLGVYFMTDAGYDPEGMVELMQILEKLGRDSRMPEFFSTHPSPDNRIGRIREAIRENKSS